MRRDNPACYECPRGKNKLHHWAKSNPDLREQRGAICLQCGLELNEEDARDVGFEFS